MKLRAHLESLDDELMFKNLSIKFGSKTQFKTPLKCGCKHTKTSGVNEIFKKFTFKSLSDCGKDESVERKKNLEIQRELSDGLNFLIVDYDDLTKPSAKELETLTDIQYGNSDIVITPIWSRLTRQLKGEELLETVISLTNDFIDCVETLNGKTIIGVVPAKMPRFYLAELISNYKNRGVSSFVIDFDSRCLSSNASWARKLFKVIKDNDLLEEGFIYSLNSNEGKFLQNKQKILAKDFIGTSFGIDFLGLNHVGPRLSSDAWKRIKENRRPNTYRIFDRNSYGYIKKTEIELIRAFGAGKGNLSLFRKRHNIIEQHKETLLIQKKLSESATLETFLESKSLVDEKIIKNIKNIRSELK